MKLNELTQEQRNALCALQETRYRLEVFKKIL